MRWLKTPGDGGAFPAWVVCSTGGYTPSDYFERVTLWHQFPTIITTTFGLFGRGAVASRSSFASFMSATSSANPLSPGPSASFTLCQI